MGYTARKKLPRWISNFVAARSPGATMLLVPKSSPKKRIELILDTDKNREKFLTIRVGTAPGALGENDCARTALSRINLTPYIVRSSEDASECFLQVDLPAAENNMLTADAAARVIDEFFSVGGVSPNISVHIQVDGGYDMARMVSTYEEALDNPRIAPHMKWPARLILKFLKTMRDR